MGTRSLSINNLVDLLQALRKRRRDGRKRSSSRGVQGMGKLKRVCIIITMRQGYTCQAMDRKQQQPPLRRQRLLRHSHRRRRRLDLLAHRQRRRSDWRH
jgi:hypothetical protein